MVLRRTYCPTVRRTRLSSDAYKHAFNTHTLLHTIYMYLTQSIKCTGIWRTFSLQHIPKACKQVKYLMRNIVAVLHTRRLKSVTSNDPCTWKSLAGLVLSHNLYQSSIIVISKIIFKVRMLSVYRISIVNAVITACRVMVLIQKLSRQTIIAVSCLKIEMRNTEEHNKRFLCNIMTRTTTTTCP